ncbi:MAG: hypothetical protein WBA11_09865, partial [Rubrivirga sp.]
IDALESVVIASRVDAPIDGRDRVIRSTMTLRLPDATRWDVRVAGRTRSVVLTSRGAFSVLEGESRPLDLEAELAVAADNWLHPLVLAAGRSDVIAVQLSPGLVRVTVDDLEDDILVGLNADGRPDLITTQRRRGGRVDYVAIRYSDYRETDGVMVPRQVIQTVAGVKTGTLSVERVEVDGDLSEALFTVPVESDG